MFAKMTHIIVEAFLWMMAFMSVCAFMAWIVAIVWGLIKLYKFFA